MVAKYRIDSIADLVRQMAYTPLEALGVQLNHAEDLLHEVDATKAYPLDFVVYRVTGFHRRIVAPDLLTGIALQHDLGLLIEQLSDRMGLVAATAREPVLSIDDVTEQFNIASKTVQRWRRRGLPARRFVFGDGKRRVGFLLSSVERFVRSHREQVIGDGPNISRVETDECDRMIRMARRLAVGGCWPEEIARRIGRRFGRSPLTVLHTIRRHDAAHPSEAISAIAAKPIGEKARLRIRRRFKRGWSLHELANRAGRPRAAIYRVLLEERVARLQKRKIRFIDDPLYHEADAPRIVEELAGDESIVSSGAAEERRVPRDLPSPLQSLCRIPPLTPARERGLFLKLNFHKFQFMQARRRLDPQFARHRDLSELERHLNRITQVRNQLISANLRLVVSIARKHLRPGLSLMELVSDGNITLMRAVDGFDVHRGHRFSTYATLALMKGFARSIAAGLPGHAGIPDAVNELVDHRSSRTDQSGERDELAFLLGRLSESERRVVDVVYGLRPAADSDLSSPRKSTRTVRELARSLGLTPPRFREIERSALAKMRGDVN
ncbi:MAG: sigma-70 family RNA polymerase sigma factor [Phycisphaerae bacterium]|nr:sigma-70 family RNA polymerase sigma factor [Phycisphaerae bacterium]